MLRKLVLLGLGLAAGAAIAGLLRRRGQAQPFGGTNGGHSPGEDVAERVAAVRDRLAVNGDTPS